MSTVGANLSSVEEQICKLVGYKYAVVPSYGTAALHLGVKFLGEHLYSQPRVGHGTLEGHKVLAI